MAVSISLSITQNSQNITNNTSSVTVKVTAKWTYGSWNATGQCTGNVTIDGKTYYWSGITFNTGRSTSGSKVIMTKTVNVSHNDDGSKKLSCSAKFVTGVSSGTVSCSGSKTLTTIPRKSSLSVTTENPTLGINIKLAVTQQSTSFTHTVTYKCGSASGTICTKSSSTSLSWKPTLDLAAQNTTGTSVSITFTITTYNGDTSIGSSSITTACAMPATIRPSVSLAVTDTTGCYETHNGYIKGLSKLSVEITASGSYGSTIVSYKTEANGKVYTGSSFTTGVLTGAFTLKTTVTDSRGRTTTATKIISVQNYSKPTVDALSVQRCNEDGTASSTGAFLAVTFGATVSSVNSANTATYTLEYKKASETTYTTATLTDYANKYSVTNGVYIFAADESSYNIRLTVADDFGSAMKTVDGASIKKFFSILAGGLGLALNKIAELEGVFDIAFKTRFTGGILQPVLEAGTDFDTVTIPNTYTLKNCNSAGYSNCPLSTGTGSLTIETCGEEGQLRQIVTVCHKTNPIRYERFYYGGAWGEWVCVSDFDGRLLWEGGYYMTAGHTAPLAEPVSKQRNGICLVFSEFVDGEAADQSFHTRFIPKMVVANHGGKAQCVQMSTSNLAYFATKYLYISDDKIVGHDNNNLTGTSNCGITYTNNRFVLRYVIGV